MKTKLRIVLQGHEQLWALKAKLEINRKQITNLEWKDVFRDWRKWEVRLPGASVPGRLIAGSFWTEEGWDFLYAVRPHGFFKPFVYGVLLIETTENRYKRIIITCSQKQAAELLKWWNQK